MNFRYAEHTCCACLQGRMCWIMPYAGHETRGQLIAYYAAICADCMQDCIEGFPGMRRISKLLMHEQEE